MLATTQYLPETGAGSTRLSELVNKLASLNQFDSIHIVVFNTKNKFKNPEINNYKISINRYNNRVLPDFLLKNPNINPIVTILWFIFLFNELIKFKPKIVICSIPSSAPLIPTSALCRLMKIKYCVDYRDAWEEVMEMGTQKLPFFLKNIFSLLGFVYKYFAKIAYTKASLITVVNDSLKNYLYYVSKNENILIVPNGVNIDELIKAKEVFKREALLTTNNLPDINDCRYIIYNGSLEYDYYKPEIFLLPLAKLIQNNKKLIYILVGDGKKRKIIQNMAQKLNIENNVFLLGNKNHMELLQLILLSDIAVYVIEDGHPEIMHAVGTKIFEYIACGTPVLAVGNRESALSKMLNKYQAGVCINWKELETLYQIVLELLNTKKNEHINRDFSLEFDRSNIFSKYCYHLIELNEKN